MSAEEIADAFIKHYYQAIDANPQSLAGLFQPASMLTFEGQQFQGPQAIVGKLQSLGGNHQVRTTDVQPSVSADAILIFVTGIVKIGGEANGIHFCQTFQLKATSPGNYYVHNGIFRLNYGL